MINARSPQPFQPFQGPPRSLKRKNCKNWKAGLGQVHDEGREGGWVAGGQVIDVRSF